MPPTGCNSCRIKALWYLALICLTLDASAAPSAKKTSIATRFICQGADTCPSEYPSIVFTRPAAKRSLKSVAVTNYLSEYDCPESREKYRRLITFGPKSCKTLRESLSLTALLMSCRRRLRRRYTATVADRSRLPQGNCQRSHQ